MILDSLFLFASIPSPGVSWLYAPFLPYHTRPAPSRPPSSPLILLCKISIARPGHSFCTCASHNDPSNPSNPPSDTGHSGYRSSIPRRLRIPRPVPTRDQTVGSDRISSAGNTWKYLSSLRLPFELSARFCRHENVDSVPCPCRKFCRKTNLPNSSCRPSPAPLPSATSVRKCLRPCRTVAKGMYDLTRAPSSAAIFLAPSSSCPQPTCWLTMRPI